MNDAERQAFLDRPFAATISTAGAGGSVHSVPAWYVYRDGVFRVWTDANRRWVRNLKRSNKVSVVVPEHEPPFGAVVVHGMAEVATDAPGTDETIRSIVERYMPPDQVDSYMQMWSPLRTIVHITPTLIRSWGRGF